MQLGSQLQLRILQVVNPAATANNKLTHTVILFCICYSILINRFYLTRRRLICTFLLQTIEMNGHNIYFYNAAQYRDTIVLPIHSPLCTTLGRFVVTSERMNFVIFFLQNKLNQYMYMLFSFWKVLN